MADFHKSNDVLYFCWCLGFTVSLVAQTFLIFFLISPLAEHSSEELNHNTNFLLLKRGLVCTQVPGQDQEIYCI